MNGNTIIMNTGAIPQITLSASGTLSYDASSFGCVIGSVGGVLANPQFVYDEKLVYDNVEEIWQQHLSIDYQEGKNWYKEAKQFSIDLATKYKRPDIVTAAVIAALSPQKQWEVNKRITNDFFERGFKATGHYYKQKKKARTIDRMKDLSNITEEDIDNVLGGLKTINFFHNIYNPDNTEYVCIDRHMIAIALGYSKSKLTIKQYAFLKEEYIKFAKKVGMIPCEFQGVLWVCYRRIKTPNFKEPDYF